MRDRLGLSTWSTEKLGNLLVRARTANILALIGGISYSWQSWYFAHIIPSVLDEGNYLYKGFLFASGKYVPYQDYGLWTNHMPLAFLIPGWVQVWFGPGLRTGRYFALLLGILGLLGLWIVVRRLSGNWLATGVVWAIALNPFVIQGYSLAISQGLAACVLIWVLVLTLGEDRRKWQLILGAGLAGVLFLTRINMSPVVILLIPYIFWQYGWRAGIPAMISGFGVVVIVHIIYWPEILNLWFSIRTLGDYIRALIPEFLMNNAIDAVDIGANYWNPEISTSARIDSFLQGIRLNLLPIFGVLATCFTWSKQDERESKTNFRMKVFLSALFAILFGVHFWASLMRNSCVFCFQGYLTFFSPIGLVLLTLAWPYLYRELTRSRQFVVILFVLVISTVIGYVAVAIFPWEIIKPLWVIFWNKFGFSSKMDFDLAEKTLRLISTSITGLFSGIVILLLPRAITKLSAYKKLTATHDFQVRVLHVMLVVVFLLSPSNILSGSAQLTDCTGDVIASHEAIGNTLSANTAAGAKVYWAGGNSPAPLLYLPENQTYPGLLNGAYSFRIGGDVDEVLRSGYRNQELITTWLQEADYLLLTGHRINVFESNREGWVELAVTAPTNPCLLESVIHIYSKTNLDD